MIGGNGMGNFDRVIGYENIKAELNTVIDMIHNRERYEKLGAKMPRGIMLYGIPGLGKTLIAEEMIKASGVTSFIIRKTKESKEFIKEINCTFEKAMQNTPSIVLLDDMDKYSNGDDNHKNTEEYVAIQSCIDNIKGYDVLVMATVNDIDLLPDSLVRKGRFDLMIEIERPTDKDAGMIIKHYLKGKPVDPNINYDDVCKLSNYKSCAALEAVINIAATYAAKESAEEIKIEHIVRSVLCNSYQGLGSGKEASKEELKRVAIHEAGHLVISEAIKPQCVGLAAIGRNELGNVNGVVHRFVVMDNEWQNALCALGGKAAEELHYGECARGSDSDIKTAWRSIRHAISGQAALGLKYVKPFAESEFLYGEMEGMSGAMLERYRFMAQTILKKNEDFFTKVVDALLEKKYLLYSDIQRIKGESEVHMVDVF